MNIGGNSTSSRYVVAVVGAAVAGSEVARILAERGALVFVFEQNARPYGKIEDGLPRWHVDQRREEYAKIDRRLSHANIYYAPLTRLGRDLQFDELADAWGLSAVILANGAWRDRPFPVEGADRYVGRGLVYQNSFIYWFNHYPEKTYSGPRYEIRPGTIVIGGGLASIDVVKVLQLEAALRALERLGIREDLLRLEREGIDPVLKSHDLTWPRLNLKPCKLYYRRTVLDMPLADIPGGADAKKVEAIRRAKIKILDKAQRKYLFDFQELSVPSGLIIEDERLAGIKIARTKVEQGRIQVVPASDVEHRAELTISSIGSIPEAIAGVAQNGEVYRYVDPKLGLLRDGRTAVFATGNVLTGKGNIKDSLDSAAETGVYVAERYLGLEPGGFEVGESERRLAREMGEAQAAMLAQRRPLNPARVAELLARVRERQGAVGYAGDYRAWIAKVLPPDLQ
jgi:NADPH-dependent glutamate synthase beta subunit-like oxidoreductase